MIARFLDGSFLQNILRLSTIFTTNPTRGFSTVRISDCMREQVDLQKKYDTLLSTHFRTQKSFWALEDKLEEYKGENSQEAELLSEIDSLKKQIGSLKRQVSRLQCNYSFVLII